MVFITFGEKLQKLRKQKGLSQEQLASQLTVSRQAVSKWELDASLPDIENVVQLSKLFGVTTDYLLINELSDIPPEKELYPQAEEKIKTAFVIGIGVIIIGLLISLIGFRTYQTELSAAIGIVIQILGVMFFIMIQNKCGNPQQHILRIFFAVSCWLICPFFALFLSEIALGIYPKPYSHWTALIVPAIIYFLICSVITIILVKPYKSKNTP